MAETIASKKITNKIMINEENLPPRMIMPRLINNISLPRLPALTVK